MSIWKTKWGGKGALIEDENWKRVRGELRVNRSRSLPEARRGACCFLRGMSASWEPDREIDCGPADPRLAWGNPQSFDTVSHPPRVRSQSSHMDRGVNLRSSWGWDAFCFCFLTPNKTKQQNRCWCSETKRETEPTGCPLNLSVTRCLARSGMDGRGRRRNRRGVRGTKT